MNNTYRQTCLIVNGVWTKYISYNTYNKHQLGNLTSRHLQDDDDGGGGGGGGVMTMTMTIKG